MDNATKTAIEAGYYKGKALHMQRTIHEYLQGSGGLRFMLEMMAEDDLEGGLEQYLESRNVQHSD